MNKLTLYFTKKLAVNLLIILVIITSLFFIIELTRFLDLVISRGVPLRYLFYITLLYIPASWDEVLPIITLFAMVFTWSSMISSNEIIIMKSYGFNNFKVAVPSLIIGLITTLVCLSFTSFFISYTSVKYEELKNKVASSFDINILEAKKFIELTPQVVIYVGIVGKGKELKNVLIDINKKQEESTIYAQSAFIVNQTKSFKLLLSNGSIQKLNKSDNSTSFVNFKNYIINSKKQTIKYKIIRTSAKDLYLWELIKYKQLPFMQKLLQEGKINDYNQKSNTFLTQIFKRGFNVLLCISFTILVGFFFNKAKFNRNSNLKPILKSLAYGLLLKAYSIVVISISNISLLSLSYILILLLDIILFIISIKSTKV